MKILIKPRLHLTLISMSESLPRVHGGIGFCLEEPKAELEFSTAEKFQFIDKRNKPLVREEIENIIAVVEQAKEEYKLETSLAANLSGEFFTHFGMGSGTSIRLACLEALFLLNKRPVEKNELIRISQRGGASGIGINTYFDGKMIFDLGIKSPINHNFKPSSSVKNPSPPQLLASLSMPNWDIGLCMPLNIRTKNQAEEIEFFERSCPIPAEESFKVCYFSLFGVYAACADGDLGAFSNSINALQNCEWKKLERAEYGLPLQEIEQALYNLGASCVGMSSLGPLLFFVTHHDNKSQIETGMKAYNCNILFTHPSNTGRVIIGN